MIEYHQSKLNYKHQWKNAPEYKAWIKMNRNHTDDVCVGWKWHKLREGENLTNYTSFRAFVGPRPKGHVLIRLDKSQPFVLGNVRWGTHAESSQHRGPYKKFSYSRDEELIAELERRGYGVTPQKLRG